VSKAFERAEIAPRPNHLYDIAKSHKGKFEPPEEIAIEAAVLRICDKLDKYRKSKKKKATEKYEETVYMVEEYICKKAINIDWDEFYNICQQMHEYASTQHKVR